MRKVSGELDTNTRPERHGKSRPVRAPNGRSAAVRTVTRLLAQSLQQCRIAQVLIEQLLQQNARLKQELVQVMHREEQARRLAYHDALTGLPNRTLLQDRFVQAMSQAKRHRKLVVMLLIDLDGFKSVNDRLGHGAGDRLLCAVAARLMESIRGEDTVCRYGGDEFVIMLPEVADPSMAAAAAEKIHARLREPGIVDGHRIRMTASIGAALYPANGKNYDQLMKHADDAMYRAKARSGHASITIVPDADPAGPVRNGGNVRNIGSER